MRKLTLLALLAILLLGALPALATAPQGGIFEMARYAPAGADGFFAVRTDDVHLALLDGLMAKAGAVAGDLNGAADFPTVRDLIVRLTGAPSDADLDAILAWSGDALAISLTVPCTGCRPQVMLAAQLTDRAAAEATVLGTMPSAVKLDPIGRYDVYQAGSQNGFALFSDDLMLVMTDVTFDLASHIASEDYPRLSDDPAYTAAVAALPAETYNAALYLSGDFFKTGPFRAFFGGTLALGATVLDDSTLTLDAAAVPATPDMQTAALDPDFARYIPAGMGATIQGANFNAALDTLFDLIQKGSGADGRGLVAQVLAFAGLVPDDLYGWTDGQFAAFARLDVHPILAGLSATPADVNSLPAALDAGLVIKVSDAAKAQRFVANLAAVLGGLVTGTDGSRVRTETVNGTHVTVLSFEMPVDAGGLATFEFAVGASDEAFALGTFSAVRAIFSGDPGLTENPAYAASARYWLPDATVLGVLDGSTIGSFAGFAALLLTPATSQSFGSATDANGNTVTTTQPPQPVPGAPTPADIDALASRIAAFLPYATFSGGVTADGVSVLRATITLGE